MAVFSLITFSGQAEKVINIIMKILTTPNPILTQPASLVEKIDKKVLAFIEEMKQTLLAAENPKGVGLAAPQVGQNLRIFLTKPFLKSEISVFINPEIIWKSAELSQGVSERNNKLEGCLSIPSVWGLVKRHKSLRLKYQSIDGKWRKQQFTGFMATIIQHEMDHLDGQLFSSRVLEQKGKFYKITKNDEGKEVLAEIVIWK